MSRVTRWLKSLEWFEYEFIYLNKTDDTVTYILNALPTLHPSQPYVFWLQIHILQYYFSIKNCLTVYNFALKNTTQKLDPLYELSINKLED